MKSSQKQKAPKKRLALLKNRTKNQRPPLPSARRILMGTLEMLRQNKTFFIGMTVVYGVLLLLFVRGIAGGVDVVSTKESIAETLGTSASNFTTSAALFTGLLSGVSATNSEIASLYQAIIVILCSLATIWGLRRISVGKSKELSVKKAFYEGMYPLVPFLAVALVIGVQLLPVTLASGLYTYVISTDFTISLAEQLIWFVIGLLLIVVSLYFIASSIFALYIATLPSMTPLQALRSAKKLVAGRRWEVLRKLLWLPIILLLFMGLIVLPFIAFVPIVAEFVFMILIAALLPVVHAYIYNVYRAML